MFDYISEEANIPFEIIYDNEHQDGGINFYIGYVGPLGGKGRQKSVKVDISRSERLTFDAIVKPALLSYSDQSEHQILCYPLEEVLVEKMRSVMQRMQARDFYDIWYLLEINKMDPSFYLKEFQQKCNDKKLKSSEFIASLEKRLPQYKARWGSSISEQIQELPEFDQVEREINRHFRNITFK